MRDIDDRLFTILILLLLSSSSSSAAAAAAAARVSEEATNTIAKFAISSDVYVLFMEGGSNGVTLSVDLFI